MKKKIIVGVVLILVALGVAVVMSVHKPTNDDAIYPRASVVIGGKAFKALVSSTDALRDKGLGQRDSLPADEVMLFAFDAPDLLGFWMKDMRFSIDMMWLDANGNVITTAKSVSPDTYPKVYLPSRPAIYVVETNAGVLESLGVKEGDKVLINQK